MRADRLVSLVLLLRQRGRQSAAALARELEVSTRTVQRDIEALSTAGVPVYAERGRHGGFALLPGFRTELTGLNQDEALALLIAGARGGAQSFGLGSALASAMLKVVDALPANHRDTAADVTERLLIDPQTDLLSRRLAREATPQHIVADVRDAVLSGRKLRLHYSATGKDVVWRTVDPIGLVTVREQGYLLAARDGEDRTYRLSRIVAAELLDEPAQRPERVDLEKEWRERSTRFRHGGDQVSVLMNVDARRRKDLASTALAILSEEDLGGSWLRIEATFQDRRHATWAAWQFGTSAEVLDPDWLRAALSERATAISTLYAEPADQGAAPMSNEGDVRRLAMAAPGVTERASYGTPAS